MGKAEDVVGKFMQEFPESGELGKRPNIEQVKEVMRPFAPISFEVQMEEEKMAFLSSFPSYNLIQHQCINQRLAWREHLICLHALLEKGVKQQG
jgi:hypothetical protein